MLKDNRLLIVIVAVIIVVAAYFMFFRKEKSKKGNANSENVEWIIKNFNAKQINHVRSFWQWVLWVREGNMDWYDEDSNTKSKETVLEEYRTKVTFPVFISWCTEFHHTHEDPNRQVISAAQAQAIKNHGITEDDWEEAYQQTFDSLI